MNQQLTIDLVEKHAIACKEQLSVENCDPNLKFYDKQKVMQEFIKIYSMSLLGNHLTNKESMSENEITDEDISQLTSEYEKMIETSKSNTDLMKIHFKVLEDFEKLEKSATMITNIRDIEAVRNENANLKKKLSELAEENLDSQIMAARDKNVTLQKEVEALEQKIKAQNEAKQIANSSSKTHKILDFFA